MSTLNAPRKVSNRREQRQDQSVPWTTQVLVYYDQNRSIFVGGLAAILIVIVGAIAYSYYESSQVDQAEKKLAQIVGAYENGNYDQALQGTDNKTGLLTLADDYGETKSGNLARYYAADALYRQEKYDRALKYFRAFEKEENLLGASAYAAMAAIHENKEEYGRAGELYEQSAQLFAGKQSPQYLIQAGRAYLDAGSMQKARQVFNRVKEDYPDSDEASSVEMYLARLEAQSK